MPKNNPDWQTFTNLNLLLLRMAFKRERKPLQLSVLDKYIIVLEKYTRMLEQELMRKKHQIDVFLPLNKLRHSRSLKK
jgi:hypothetical protein